ncbi:hypothetical protein AB0A81_27250 [Streptomyces flaveolus]|uniref:Transposase n=1 Tax=Streptomyces flaveolus TaxID=67297 RepID=A0ABV1VBQ3_9ACTN
MGPLAQPPKVSPGRHGGWADGSRALLGYVEEGDCWARTPVACL